MVFLSMCGYVTRARASSQSTHVAFQLHFSTIGSICLFVFFLLVPRENRIYLLSIFVILVADRNVRANARSFVLLFLRLFEQEEKSSDREFNIVEKYTIRINFIYNLRDVAITNRQSVDRLFRSLIECANSFQSNNMPIGMRARAHRRVTIANAITSHLYYRTRLPSAIIANARHVPSSRNNRSRNQTEENVPFNSPMSIASTCLSRAEPGSADNRL